MVYLSNICCKGSDGGGWCVEELAELHNFMVGESEGGWRDVLL
jgi:hypothetical protein